MVAKMANIKQCKINAQKKYEKAKKDIISLITGLYKEEYKKKDGSWNINKIAKDTGYTRPTVYKHLKDANLL
jgi:transcriptional regulator of acetoin/glycerol metabolism